MSLPAPFRPSHRFRHHVSARPDQVYAKQSLTKNVTVEGTANSRVNVTEGMCRDDVSEQYS